jgi:hypothetical protein
MTAVNTNYYNFNYANFRQNPQDKKMSEKHLDIRFTKKNIPEFAALTFCVSLFPTLSNWDSLAKDSGIAKMTRLSLSTACSALASAGLMSAYKIGKKLLFNKQD